MKEHVYQKKTTCPEGGRNRKMQKTRGSSPFGQTEEQEEEQHRLHAERKKEQEEAERQHLELSAVEKEIARLREQQTAMMAQMQAKIMRE
jgi:hypothetical protein